MMFYENAHGHMHIHEEISWLPETNFLIPYFFLHVRDSLVGKCELRNSFRGRRSLGILF